MYSRAGAFVLKVSEGWEYKLKMGAPQSKINTPNTQGQSKTKEGSE